MSVAVQGLSATNWDLHPRCRLYHLFARRAFRGIRPFRSCLDRGMLTVLAESSSTVTSFRPTVASSPEERQHRLNLLIHAGRTA
jgi:hypothetical protein